MQMQSRDEKAKKENKAQAERKMQDTSHEGKIEPELATISRAVTRLSASLVNEAKKSTRILDCL
jgi:hypothetical protein